MEQKQLTREEHKKERKQDNQEVKQKKIRIRLIPIWLRIILFVILIVVAVGAGAMVGYSVMGDGKPSEIFEKETWTHIIDLVKKDI